MSSTFYELVVINLILNLVTHPDQISHTFNSQTLFLFDAKMLSVQLHHDVDTSRIVVLLILLFTRMWEICCVENICPESKCLHVSECKIYLK